MNSKTYINKSLEELENDYWGEPSYDSHLVKTCHSLRKKPLKDFETKDLRILIGQSFSLDILIPLAFIELEKNILAEGDCYEGDLLVSVLNSNKKYWINNSEKWLKLCDLISNNIDTIINSDNPDEIKNDIFILFEKFKKIK